MATAYSFPAFGKQRGVGADKSVDQLVEDGEGLAVAHNFKAALQALTVAESKAREEGRLGKCVEAEGWMTFCYQDLGDVSKAIDCARRLQLDLKGLPVLTKSESESAYIYGLAYLAQQLLLRGCTQEAIAVLEQERSYTSCPYWFAITRDSKLAGAYTETGQFERARQPLAAIRQAETLFGDFSGARNPDCADKVFIARVLSADIAIDWAQSATGVARQSKRRDVIALLQDTANRYLSTIGLQCRQLLVVAGRMKRDSSYWPAPMSQSMKKFKQAKTGA